LGPDVADLDYVAWQCDQDAYAMSGQKCSAQSLLFVHTSWAKAGLLDRLKQLASTRRLEDLTCSPILSHTNDEIAAHVKALQAIPGSKLLFGGRPLTGHSVPSKYGAFEPTAVFVPLKSFLADEALFKTVTTELFGPVQVVTEWTDSDEASVIEVCERIGHHLTAAVVSSDLKFVNKMLGATVNGTTYAGARARTTGAPQNHWFGPAGNPLAAGIGTPEAVLSTWTCHREIIMDCGPIPSGWTTPPPT